MFRRLSTGFYLALKSVVMKYLFIKMSLIVFLMSCSSAQAVILVYGESSGYITDIESEEYLKYYELNISLPKKVPSKNYYKLIFRSNLVSEFKYKYKESFGQAAGEQAYVQTNHFIEVRSSSGLRRNIGEDNKKQKRFGGYMMKRLIEHHVDYYVKNSPELKTLYEIKERLSHVKVEVKRGYEVKLHYSLTGNYIDFKVTNPYDVKAIYTLEMSTESFGPSKVIERILALGYAVTPSIYVTTQYQTVDKSLITSLSKTLRKNLALNITGKLNSKLRDSLTEELISEDLFLLGLSWEY